MAIVRTYECGVCSTRFDKLHFDRSEPAPECPGCAALAAKQVPAGFAIGNSNLSKAADLAQNIMEVDYGQSNFKDNMREGDVAAISPPAINQQAQKFWAPAGDVLQSAKVAAAASKREGSNPLTLVQRVAKARGPSGAKVLCRPVNNVR